MLDKNKYPFCRHEELYEWSAVYQEQRGSYTRRYGSLRQNTTFFENMLKLGNIMRNSSSYPEYIVKCAARGIPEKKAAFFLLYCGVCPERFLLFDWGDVEIWECDDKKYKGWTRFKEWIKFKEMYKEAVGCNCSTYAEFVERAL